MPTVIKSIKDLNKILEQRATMAMKMAQKDIGEDLKIIRIMAKICQMWKLFFVEKKFFYVIVQMNSEILEKY